LYRSQTHGVIAVLLHSYVANMAFCNKDMAIAAAGGDALQQRRQQ
jgi:hypothetical protein